jgi:hypothetical protein
LSRSFEFAFGQRLGERGNQRNRGDEQRAHALLEGLGGEGVAGPTQGLSDNKLSLNPGSRSDFQ